MNKLLSCLSLGAVSLLPLAGLAAEVPLYETGPSEDSSFLRFVNATQGPIEVVASGSKAKTSLTPEKPFTSYFPVKAKTAIKGTLVSKSTQSPIDVSVEPGEFATVFALAGSGQAITPEVIREQPDDFNATKVSLAFYSVDPACQNTSLHVAGRTVALFDAVPAGQLKRRLINPVTLSVQLLCAGKAVGEPLALGELQAGQRYSVFAVPGPTDSAGGTRLLLSSDAVAN